MPSNELVVERALRTFRENLVGKRLFGAARIGFTGSREGPTKDQRDVWEYMSDGLEGVLMHNGCALGADRYVITHAGSGWSAVFWPANQDGLNWATDIGSPALVHGTTHAIRPPLERNRYIVNASEGMIAMPITMEEQRRSGTWATIRYARNVKKPVLVIGPNGQIWFDGSMQRLQV